MKDTQPLRVRIGVFELNLQSGELRSGDQKIVLREQPLQVLRMLVERDGELVTRLEIMKKLWPNNTIVEFDHSINAAIKNLRRALNDSADNPKYIETLARRGYQLMVPVEWLSAENSAPAVSPAGAGTAVRSQPEPSQPAAKPDSDQPPPSPAAQIGEVPHAVESGDTQTLHPQLDPSATIFSTGDVIAGRYLAVRFIAKGGMGQVFEVDDLELKSRVALKTITPARASSPRQVARFRREIQLARKVGHPNVCRVFDFGRHTDNTRGEVLFLTMEIVPGETLSARLREHGAMSPKQVSPLIRQMVSALSAAHELGIVHRDFKPGNVILLPEGASPNLKITDFGLAITPESQDTLTGTSPEVVGTPEYMAPEQLRGQYSTRTDIYALGVTVFQMVTGTLPASYQAPFKAPTSGSGNGKASGSSGKVKSAGSSGRHIGLRWRDAITKAMAPDPADRFASVEEFWSALSGEHLPSHSVPKAIAHSLRRHPWIYALISCALIALVALAMTGVIRNPFRAQSERHLAVLPFLNIGTDPTDTAFAEGISETLTNKLSQLERFQKSFWVVPSADARTVKSLDQAHRDLDVTLAITGSVERTPDGVNITADLVNAADHRQLASRSIHVPSTNLEDLQQNVWEAVADMLDLQVPAEVKKELAADGTLSPEAYRLYEEGNGYLQRGSPDDVDRAIDLLTKSIAIDPKYALAYAGLGRAYAWKYARTQDPQWSAKATQSAGRAVELNDKLIPARMGLARVYRQTGQPDKALAEYKRVLEQDPTVTLAEYNEASIYESQGRYRQAEDVLKHAISRHPTYWGGYDELGDLYYTTGRFNEAVQQFQTELDLAPDNPDPYYSLGGTYLALGRYDDAIDVLKKGLSIKPSAEEWTNLGAAYMYLGKWEEAADAMKRATELSPHNDSMWRNLGDAYDQIPSHLADARQAYQKALELATEQLNINPKSARLLSHVALYHAHLGQKDEAETFINRALEVAPSNSNVLFTAALVYEIIGNRDNALKAVADAVKAGYSVEEIDKEPELRALHSDPRYKAWLGQIRSHPSSANH